MRESLWSVIGSRQRLVTGLVAFLLASAAAIVRAEDAPIATLAADESVFNENYDKAVKSSGSPLVGLRFRLASRSADPGAVDLADVRVALASNNESGHYCAEITTLDARFLAVNDYVVDSGIALVARLSPVTVEYPNILQEYPLDDFAIRVFIPKENCQKPTGALHVPEVLAPTSNVSRSAYMLEARVNGDSRQVRAYLYAKDPAADPDGTKAKWLVEGLCVHLREESGLAYNHVCRLPASGDNIPVNSELWLQLELNDGRRDEIAGYRVFIPESS